MDAPHLVEEKVREHSAEKDRTRPRLGEIYAMLASLFGVVARDARGVFRGCFPALGTRPFMNAHARALLLPIIKDETNEHLRDRLTHASHYMQYLGTRKSLVEFMDSHFRGRYTIIEMPKDAFTVGHAPYGTPIGSGARIMNGEGLYIWLKNLTETEKETIENYLDTNTPPDVGYFITNKKIS